MENTILKFKEAALALQQEPCYQKMQEARKANDADEELQTMLGDFHVARLALKREIDSNEGNNTRMEELKEGIDALYSRILNNENMQAYNLAKDEMEDVMVYVNAILNAAVDGEDPMQVEKPQPPSMGCIGSCNSCAGCS